MTGSFFPMSYFLTTPLTALTVPTATFGDEREIEFHSLTDQGKYRHSVHMRNKSVLQLQQTDRKLDFAKSKLRRLRHELIETRREVANAEKALLKSQNDVKNAHDGVLCAQSELRKALVANSNSMAL